ncbi:hypothetical protein HK097_006142 [Rhizophlyctis rosea]|uniref:NADH dehydrogenase [ubiquinone] 1 beta subcomplex subunit 8, mitochondrial n=1 Tax=Rhizophlyctis rosea TaxID=64517 RepID=A0AAD5SE99_9FUNG|nr:hypothetical protein HK097_006142 [Rhizophlyctis rosea]
MSLQAARRTLALSARLPRLTPRCAYIYQDKGGAGSPRFGATPQQNLAQSGEPGLRDPNERVLESSKLSQNVRAAPDRYMSELPSAAELWTRRHMTEEQKRPVIPPIKPENVFQHPLYTPLEPVPVGIGPLVHPLKWPEYDQSKLSRQDSGLRNGWYYKDFEDYTNAPIGDYPVMKLQWTELKDPFKYWDQQGRRNYGDILPDNAHQTDEWSVGPLIHLDTYYESWRKIAMMLAGMVVFVLWLDPASYAVAVPREYPWDGLRVELGGDPNDPTDTHFSANKYTGV